MRTKIILAALALTATTAQAKDHGNKRLTVEEAISDAESALDNGRLGDAFDEAERLQKTHGLKKGEQDRVELIVARCALMRGNYPLADKLLGKRYRALPDDTRVAEWYGRALDGDGKGEQAFGILSPLAEKNKLEEGDSYWTLAQLEHKKGADGKAKAHAEEALQKPIVLQSQQLDDEIHDFIKSLSSSKQK
jgi:hypothetical protein